ncbi:eCIS core domain-containing protein [Sporocytophaga myxococcoides]|nr:DUF4157 domain-containing protein [Sporocytophaga myxococcoides]
MGEFLNKSRQGGGTKPNLHQSQHSQLKANDQKSSQSIEEKSEDKFSKDSSLAKVLQGKWDSSEGGEENNQKGGPVPPMLMEEDEEPVQRKGPVPLQFHAAEEEDIPVQRKGPVPPMSIENEEEQPIQRKGPIPLQFYAIEEEEEPVQRKGPVPPISFDQEELSQSGSSSSDKMPPFVQRKMESSFGEDFSDVNIHANSSQSKDLNAHAFAKGNDIHFAPGRYNPESQKGQELLGHELTHVVQQRQGRVQSTAQKKGVGINDDVGLEKEADLMGEKAAKGEQLLVGNSLSTQSSDKMPIQKKKKEDVLKSVSDYKDDIASACQQYGIEEKQLKAIIAVESAGIKDATSGSAFGLMQLTEETWNDTRKRYPELKAYDFGTYWKNPKVNIMFGAATFKLKLKSVGVNSQDKNFAAIAITAYNAGEGTVKKAINYASAAGCKDPYSECFNAQYLKPAIKDTGIYKYYLTGKGKKSNKTGSIEEAIELKYNEVLAYPNKVNEYLDLQNGKENKDLSKQIAETSSLKKGNKESVVNMPGIQSSGATYVVKKGETLDIIANKNSVSKEDLIKWNLKKLRKWGNIEGFEAGEAILIRKDKLQKEEVKSSTPEPGIMNVLFNYFETSKDIVSELYNETSEGISRFFYNMLFDNETNAGAQDKTSQAADKQKLSPTASNDKLNNLKANSVINHIDRVAAARGLVSIPYKQETDSGLRTGDSKDAKAFMDCSEFVCRVLYANGVTDKVEQLNSDGLKNLLSNNKKFEHSNSAKAGDIALWDGHVGIVSSVEGAKIRLIHARGEGKLSSENKYHILPSEYRTSKFYGYYSPKQLLAN